jgi:predicted nucleic acid-binding protein
MLDSSVLVPALGRARATDDAACRPLFDSLIASGCRVLIAAPTAAEIYRRSPTTAIPRTRLVEVVPFDALAAIELGQRFPPDVLKTFRQGKIPLDYIKYDAMIVACAIRHRAQAFVSTDEHQRKLASAVGLTVKYPRDYLSKQQEMYEATASKKRRKKKS